MSDSARTAVESAIERYVASLRREGPASCNNQRRPREEAAAYGLGMVRALAAIEDELNVANRSSLALAVKVMDAARDAHKFAPRPARDAKSTVTYRFPKRLPQKALDRA